MHENPDKSRSVIKSTSALHWGKWFRCLLDHPQMKEWKKGDDDEEVTKIVRSPESVCVIACVWPRGWNDVALQYGFNETFSPPQTLSLKLPAAAVNPTFPTAAVWIDSSQSLELTNGLCCIAIFLLFGLSYALSDWTVLFFMFCCQHSRFFYSLTYWLYGLKTSVVQVYKIL